MPLLKRYFREGIPEAGVDEAGRGCLAGPVVAAAVILPAGYSSNILNDSKQLTARQRHLLSAEIKEAAVAWHVAFVPPALIDEINILRATWRAMTEALEALATQPQHIIVDGNSFSGYGAVPFQTIVKGDSLYYSIAAASVLAKHSRDKYMETIALEYPQYGWERNKGYPTRQHREAIAGYGITPHHRKSFALTNRQMKFGF